MAQTASSHWWQIALFGAVKLTKNADIETYRYLGYGIGFDGNECFSYASGGTGRNAINFEADMNSSIPVDNKKKEKRHFNSWEWSNTRIR